MRQKTRLRALAAALVLLVFSSPVLAPRAAETLPAQLNDAEYWRLISEFSEPSGYFQYDIVTSNETSYQYVLPDLMKTPRSGGAYLGVGPEQNFTYIAALQPKIAFIFDIRRDMMLEHLMYKAVFEMSADRVQFVANLFARKAPAQLSADSSGSNDLSGFFQSAGRSDARRATRQRHSRPAKNAPSLSAHRRRRKRHSRAFTRHSGAKAF